MRIDLSFYGAQCRLLLVCLFCVFLSTPEALAQSRSAKNDVPIRQTFRLMVPASFSTVSPSSVVYANLETSEASNQFKPQQWTINSHSSRGLNLSLFLDQPVEMQSLDSGETVPEAQLKVALRKVSDSSLSSRSGRSLQSSMQSVEWLDRDNLNWQTEMQGAGRLKISVAPSVSFLQEPSTGRLQFRSTDIPLATITSEVTEFP